MIDEMTRESLRVTDDAIGGPYLMVTIDQLMPSAPCSTATRCTTG